MLETRFVTTADGRRLAYCVGGDADGFPVFALHGTPGGRLLRRDDIYASVGVLGISYDRPGYGQSTRHQGRTVADGAGDIAAIADDLGLTTFAVFGVSGGGPHALAVAALLPDRVIRCATMVGIAPYGVASLDYSDRTKGMAALRSAGEAAIEKVDARLLGWSRRLRAGNSVSGNEPVGPAARGRQHARRAPARVLRLCR